MGRLLAVRRHLPVPAGYLAAAIVFTWPLARDFATHTIGDVYYDERHAIWVLWYTAQAMAGAAPWPWTTALHYPAGISLVVDGVGPLNALLALPFWPWGPAAAYNGTALTGIVLSGWLLYALARQVGLPRGPSFVAGLLFMLWPIHLIAVRGHLEKLFVGLLPLSLSAGIAAFDPRRSLAWCLAPALALFATLLQNGNQFVFAALGLGLLGAMRLVRTAAPDRRAVLIRTVTSGAISVLLCAPVLAVIARTMADPALYVSMGDQAHYYAPDVLNLLLPSPHQLLGVPLFPPELTFDFAWASRLGVLSRTEHWYGTGLETAVTIPLTAIALGGFAWRRAGAEARMWLLFGLAFTVLCLGPWLRVAGLGLPELRVPLPYLLLTQVPGLDVMRTPGRFMMLASVGLSLGAGFGLAAALRIRPRRATALLTAVMGIALIELAPRGWPQTALPEVPGFYRAIANDPPTYAVLDLPHAWHGRSHNGSAYMVYQTVHRKPIAWAYLSRYYRRFPVEGLDGLWHVEVRDSAAIRARLRKLGYRYVVWHRHPEMFGGGHVADGYLGRPFEPARPADSDGFIREAFAGETPFYEDELVTVFLVDRADRSPSPKE